MVILLPCPPPIAATIGAETELGGTYGQIVLRVLCSNRDITILCRYQNHEVEMLKATMTIMRFYCKNNVIC